MSLYDWQAARLFDFELALPRLIRNAWIAYDFINLIGFSGWAGSGMRILLLGREGIDASGPPRFQP